MEIQILENEYWWGGIVDIGMEMPWDNASVCTIDPSTMGKDSVYRYFYPAWAVVFGARSPSQ